jgi:hypothetical protein
MMKEEYEYQTDAVARMHRRTRSAPSIRRRCEADSFSSAFNACPPRTRLQKEITRESESSRTQTKSQPLGLGPRLPRHDLVDRFRFVCFAGEFRIGEPLACDLANSDVKALGIGHLAIVKPERLFVQIPKQVERFDADVRALKLSLDERPKVLHAVRVDVAVRVLDRVIDNLVFEVLVQAVVRQQFIGKNRGSRFHVFVDLALKFGLAPILYVHYADISASLQHAEHNLFILAASAADNASALRLMHVARFAADEGFVNLYFAIKLAAPLALLCESDAVEHKPSGFLSDIKSAGNFARANTIFAIEDQPHCGQPLIQAERRLFKNGADLNRELPLRMPRAALPAELILEKADFLGAASRAHNAVFPLSPTSDEIVQAVLLIGEMQDCFLQALRLFDRFHDSILRWNRGLVKYIFAIIWHE